MVGDLLHHLDTNGSVGLEGIQVGLEGIPLALLRELLQVLTEPPPIIYQQSWPPGEVPGHWRGVSGMPIYKKGCKEDLESHRPVSLTLVLGKVMEQLIVVCHQTVQDNQGPAQPAQA